MRRLGTLLLCLLALSLPACGVSDSDVAEFRSETLDEAAVEIRGELQSMLSRARTALDEVESALAKVTDENDRFDALEGLRRRHGLDGLLLDWPAGDAVWAGRSVDLVRLPARPPWENSFQHGAVRYHEGPFMRALVVERNGILGGHGYATFILDEHRPGDVAFTPFAERWLDPLDLREVALHSPSLAPKDAAGTSRRLVSIPDGAGGTALVAELSVPGTEAVAERLAQRGALRLGIVLLLLWLGVVLAVRRFAIWRVRSESGRWLLAGILVLVARHALFWVDLPGRFRALEPLFAPDRFSVQTPLGWLESPADFFISATAWLGTTICLLIAERRAAVIGHRGVRLAFLAGAPFLAAATAGGWLLLVERTVFGGEATFFQVAELLPPLSDILLLAGLVVISAVAYLLITLILSRALRAWPATARGPGRLILGASAMALTGLFAWVVGEGGWVALGLPLVAILIVGRSVREPQIGIPSRVLLMSVLATALLLPLLWMQVERRERALLDDRLEALLAREAEVRPHLEHALAELSVNEHVKDALERAADGPRPEGLALAVWFTTDFASRGDPGMVTVLDARGRAKDQFALASVPPGALPRVGPQPDDAPDTEVTSNQSEEVRALIGRLRVRADDGAVLGYVVLTVPDLLDLKLHRLEQGLVTAGSHGTHALGDVRGLQVAALDDGEVESADDPSVAKRLGGFGPAELAELGPERPSLGWRDDDWHGYAEWVPQRSRVIAIRRSLPGPQEVLLAVARVIAVGVGLGAIAALVYLLITLRSFKPMLHHKILLAFFGISIVPLTLLGVASAREAMQRYDTQLTERLQTDLARVRGDMRALGPSIFHQARDQKLVTWSAIAHHDVLLYGRGRLEATSRRGLVSAELLSSRLPPDVYRATVLERREVIRREVFYAGREVWFGYTPIPDDLGRTRATVAVPLLYDEDRVQAAVTVTGSALLAGYLLAVVLVLVIGIYAARNLTRPLSDLATGTQRVAQGELDLELPGEGEDELGSLVAAFNAMTRELRETTERAAQAEREMAWRGMARQIAHEIRNPLTPMRLMIQQMQAAVERDPEAAKGAIDKTVSVLLRQIDALRKIAGDFANFARQPKRNLKQVQLGDLIQHVVTLHGGQSAKGVTVLADIAEGPLPVWGDEEELRRVILNLVSNAVQSIEDEGRVRVSAAVEAVGGHPGVRLEVADSGSGIPDGDRARLFDPHFSTKTSGTGLGLAIVARIVQDMGGTIDVESTIGRGTTFSLWFSSQELG